MTTEDRIKRQKEMVELTGRFYDKKGLQPVAGRVIGLLMIMDKEQYTFDEIVEELKISKSSASNALRMLEVSDFIEYITVPGDRKRYFRLKKRDKYALIDEHHKTLSETRDYLKIVLELKADRNSGTSVFIKDILDMLNFFLDHFMELKSIYEKKK
jgi:DNA-binding transcriptional regulator GbsR (MarR family)